MLQATRAKASCAQARPQARAVAPLRPRASKSVSAVSALSHKQRVPPYCCAQKQAVSLPRRAALGLPLFSIGLAPLRAQPSSASDSGPFEVYSIADVANVDWSKVKEDIMEIIKDESVPGSGIGEKGPTLVRLAWHSSGTYDRMLHDGGCTGTMRFKEEVTHGANAGLDKPVQWMEPVRAKHPGLSYADLYTYAGVVAIEAMGGPSIGFKAGRVDAMTPDAVTPDGRLPNADEGSPTKTAAGLREKFGRMGFNDQEIVVLSGAHALGRCHEENSGYVGPWQATPTIFSNIYFVLLKKVKWTPNESTPKFQYKDPTGSLMMLPSDIVLTQDEGFNQYVELYAKDRKKFYADFAVAFQKLEELGTSGLVSIA